ncbi:MAG: hypothetical protein JSR18_10580 [Proteobacteria bacterium]|nr:hypothetical protein [Pseudomonadota bacterium]
MNRSSTAGQCLVFRRGPDCRLGSTFVVGTRRYRVVREINDWGRQAVIARPCRWYDGVVLATARVAQVARRLNRRAWTQAVARA